MLVSSATATNLWPFVLQCSEKVISALALSKNIRT